MSNVPRPSKLIRLAVALVLGASLPALAQGPAPAPTPTPPATPTINPPQAPIPPAGSPATPAVPASQLKAFKEIVKEAKESDGFFKVFTKEDKTWIEIKPDQFDKPFFFSTVATNSLGEHRLYAGLMQQRHIVFFKKIGTHVQLIAQNQRFRAKEGSSVSRAVKSSFSDSLLASRTRTARRSSSRRARCCSRTSRERRRAWKRPTACRMRSTRAIRTS